MRACACVWVCAGSALQEAETSVEEWRGHWVKRRAFLFVTPLHMWTSHGGFTDWFHTYKYCSIHTCKSTIYTLMSLRQTTVSICAPELQNERATTSLWSENIYWVSISVPFYTSTMSPLLRCQTKLAINMCKANLFMTWASRASLSCLLRGSKASKVLCG